MIMSEITIIIGVVFFALLIFCLIVVSKTRKRAQDELSGKKGVYKGPAGEPQWSGKLPAKVNDYVCPRYVYENLVESTEYLPQNGRIIGYRISPVLVIHSRVQYNVNPPVLKSYIRRLGGKLLDPFDVLELRDNWKEVSALRIKAGDKALGKFQFWCCSQEGFPVCAKEHDRYIFLEDMIGFDRFYAPLILKR